MVTRSVTEKIQLRVVPTLITMAGVGLLATGAFLFFPQNKSASNSLQPPSAYQAPGKVKYATGVVLVKFKPITDVQAIIGKVLKKDQEMYVEKAPTNNNSGKSEKKLIHLTLQGTTRLFPTHPIPDAVNKKILKRPGIAANLEALKHSIALDQWYRIAINDDADIPVLAQSFAADPGVSAAEPELVVNTAVVRVEEPGDGSGGGSPTPLPTPNDPYYSSSWSFNNPYRDLWGLQRIRMEYAWRTTTGSSSVVVAVADTGLDYTHPDIQDKVWANTGETGLDFLGRNKSTNGIDDDANGYVDDYQGYDFTQCAEFSENGCLIPKVRGNDPMDDFGHGTHVSGTISATTNNALGIAGINWRAKIMPVKMLNSQGNGTEEDAAQSLIYAVDNGADVINMSWGGRGTSQLFSDAVRYGSIHGVLFIASAGNSADDAAHYTPGNIPEVVTVAAWQPNDTTAWWSNWGDKLSLAAPGVGILSLRAVNTDLYANGATLVPLCSDHSSNPAKCPGSKYLWANGTSMAAPHVAGAAALLLSVNSSLAPEMVKQILEKSTEDVLEVGKDRLTGYGLLNVAAALAVVNQPVTELWATHGAITPIDSTRAQLSADVKNVGALQATNVEYSIFLGNGVVGLTSTIPTLRGGETYTINYTFRYSDLRDSALTVQIDPRNLITEYSKTNDALNAPLPVLSLAGWPKSVGLVASSPAIGDLDVNSAGLEVVIGSGDGNVYAWHADGTSVPGWPKTTGGGVDSSPALVDLDGDARLDVVVGSYDNTINAWHADGSTVAGWPKTIQAYRLAPPAVADINGDGKPEVVVATYAEPGPNGPIYAKVHVWRQSLTNPSVWEDFPNWPKTIYHGSYAAAPVLADLDPFRAGLEIILATDDPSAGGTYQSTVYAWHSDGTDVPGWPVTDFNGLSYSTPAVDDIDGDGHLEVIVGAEGEVFAWHSNGSRVNGWPQPVSSRVYSSPVTADLDQSYPGQEIVVGSGNPSNDLTNKIFYAWHADGTPVSGWPQAANDILFSSPAIADLNGDGTPEVVIGTRYPTGGPAFVYAFRANGSVVPGWPIPTLSSVFSSPAVADVNLDGHLEVVVGSMEGNVYAWTVPLISTTTATPWPTFHHDNRRTGVYIVPPSGGGGKRKDIMEP